LKHSKLSTVEVVPPLLLRYHARNIERPNTNFADLEWVKDVHCDRVGALIREMASNSAAQSLVCLADIDWFSVVIEERVDTPLVAADFLPIIRERLEKSVYLLAYGDDVSGWAERICACFGRWLCR